MDLSRALRGHPERRELLDGIPKGDHYATQMGYRDGAHWDECACGFRTNVPEAVGSFDGMDRSEGLLAEHIRKAREG